MPDSTIGKSPGPMFRATPIGRPNHAIEPYTNPTKTKMLPPRDPSN
jgi:hypothetical protein